MNIEIIRNTLYKVVPPTVGSSRVLACRWGGPWACWLDLHGVLFGLVPYTDLFNMPFSLLGEEEPLLS